MVNYILICFIVLVQTVILHSNIQSRINSNSNLDENQELFHLRSVFLKSSMIVLKENQVCGSNIT
jgi:hypothetical protein